MPPAADHANAAPVQTALAEFSALRNEIAGRSSAQHTLISLNITAMGAVAGFVLASESRRLLLLLLPLLSPAIGMLYLDHALNIINIGNYINDELKSILRLIRYEEVVRSYEHQQILRILLYGLPIFVIFAGAPIGSLVVTAGLIQETWTWLLWGMGLILVSLYLSFWMFFILRPSLSQSASRESTS